MSRRRPVKVDKEVGLTLYGPTATNPKYRLSYTDPFTGERCQPRRTDATEAFSLFDETLVYLRTARMAAPVSGARPHPSAPRKRRGATPTVDDLFDARLKRWAEDGCSTRYVDTRQGRYDYRIRPVVGGLSVRDWAASSEGCREVLRAARVQGLAPASVQDLGALMRGLVTLGWEKRWIPPAHNPMLGVRYTAGASVQGQGPEGFASHLGTEGQPWERVWRHFASRIVDGDDNANNRFDVAAELNRNLGLAVFWGCPRPLAGLSPKLKVLPGHLDPNPFPVLRHIDRLAGTGIKSVWQLYGGVTVGSQVLMGLPYLQRLRDRYRDPLLVWPQQTGFVHDPIGTGEGAQILLVEIWPTALRPIYEEGGVRDEQQVRWCVGRCLEQQEAPGGLGPWFAPRQAKLAAPAQATVASEEGWILGVGASA